MKKYIMGMDQGTTGTKVILVDYDSNIAGIAYSEFTQHFPQPGYVEHDADEIWKVSMKVAADAMKKADVKPEQLAAIGITNQRETSLFWDKKTSAPACRAQVWQDTRTIGIVEELQEKGGAELVARTGMVIVTNCGAAKLIWMLRNDPKVQEGDQAGQAGLGHDRFVDGLEAERRPGAYNRSLQPVGHADAECTDP